MPNTSNPTLSDRLAELAQRADDLGHEESWALANTLRSLVHHAKRIETELSRPSLLDALPTVCHTYDGDGGSHGEAFFRAGLDQDFADSVCDLGSDARTIADRNAYP